MDTTRYSEEKIVGLQEMGISLWQPRASAVIAPLAWQLVNRQSDWWVLTEEANDDALMGLLDAILSAAKVSRSFEDTHINADSADTSLSREKLSQLINEQPIKPACLLVMGSNLCQRIFSAKPHAKAANDFASEFACPVVLTHALSDLSKAPKLKRDTWEAIKTLI